MGQPSVTPKASVRDPRKLYQRAKKKRGLVDDPAFRELTAADYAVLRALLDAPPLIKRGRPKTTAAGVAEARVTVRVRYCPDCPEGVQTPLGRKCQFCPACAEARHLAARKEWNRRYVEKRRRQHGRAA
jgi:hypothetical protein